MDTVGNIVNIGWGQPAHGNTARLEQVNVFLPANICVIIKTPCNDTYLMRNSHWACDRPV